MSLENYNKLDSSQLNLEYGLPQLKSKTLTRRAEKIDLSAVRVLVEALSPTDGWQMYKDGNEVSVEQPKGNLIEAQYTNGQDSLHVKLAGHQYIVTTLMVTETANDTQVVKEQVLLLSNKVKPYREAMFQIWYEQSDSKWKPIAQQFMGLLPAKKEGEHR